MFRNLFGRDQKLDAGRDPVPQPTADIASRQSPSTNSYTPVPWAASGLVHRHGDEWTVSCSTVPEARFAKREIRARQKELRVQKRELNAEMTQIRAYYRQKNANRGPAVRGLGGFGRTLRALDQMGRASDRSNREKDLASYERAKLMIDNEINTLDRLTILLDQAIESLQEDK